MFAWQGNRFFDAAQVLQTAEPRRFFCAWSVANRHCHMKACVDLRR